jgi:multimeric flavodoxin WrbA
MHKHQNSQLFEGLEHGDLKRLIHPKLHIDEFKSKMGDDADIIVLSFKTDNKEPAKDLMNFIERGYEWILDADISAGELEDGEYLVFAELARDMKSAKNIQTLIKDILNLTDQKISEWKFQYRKDSSEYDLTVENINRIVPTSPEAYVAKFGETDEVESDEIDAMKETARVPMNKKAPVNDFTESLRVAAGLK